MTDLTSFLRLQAWLSPAFPTGAFSYSHGLEAAVAGGLVTDKGTLATWLGDLLVAGPGWNDSVLLAESWRLAHAGGSLDDIAELANAMSLSAERHLETTAQGGAFLKAAAAWGAVPQLPDDCALPVAVGAVAGSHTIALESTLSAFLHAYVSNQIQAALRLMALGQQGGVGLLATLEPIILQIAQRAAASSLDDLGSNTVMADIAAMQHETMATRIFRS